MSKNSRAYLIYEILLFEYFNRWTGHIRFYKSGFTAVSTGHVHRAFSHRSVYINVAHQLTTIDLELNKGNLVRYILWCKLFRPPVCMTDCCMSGCMCKSTWVDVNYSEVLCCLLMSHTLNFRHQFKEIEFLLKISVLCSC